MKHIITILDRAQWLGLVLKLPSAVIWFKYKGTEQKFGVKQILTVARRPPPSAVACTFKWDSDAKRVLLCKCHMSDRCFVEFILFYYCKYVLMQSAVLELTTSSEKLIDAPALKAANLTARSAVDRYQGFRRSFREWCILWSPRRGPCMAVAVERVRIIIIITIISLTLATGPFSQVLLLSNQRWSQTLRLQASDCSTFSVVCYVPRTAVFM